MEKITVQTELNVPVEKVWEYWTNPVHIINWNAASPDWHTPRATNDLKVGGKFTTRMEARDGSAGFDFEGVYSAVEQYKHIAYGLDDGRQIDVSFETTPSGTKVTEIFDGETENSAELQRSGWQSILDNFKLYVHTQENYR
jgi:uncharacterized protein YndB with AHSA1/START domain